MRLEQTRRDTTSWMPQSRPGTVVAAHETDARRRRPRWRSRRAGLSSSGWLALLRVRRSWALLSAVALGILVAVVLICTVPLYNTLITDVQLQRELNDAGPFGRNVQVRTDTTHIEPALRTTNDAKIRPLAQQYLRTFVAASPSYIVESDLTLLTNAGSQTFNPATPKPAEVRFQAFDYAVAAAHMHFIAGGPPQPSAVGAVPQAVPQAAVTQEMAQNTKLTVGSTISVTQFGNHAVHFTVSVSGIWVPDPNDPYWNGRSFSAQSSDDSPPIYPIQLTYDDLLGGLSTFTGLSMSQYWVYTTLPRHVTIDNLDAVRNNLARFRSGVDGNISGLPGISRVQVTSALETVLADVSQQQALLALPLYVIVAQIVALALLFVGAMASLLVEGQSQDIATLKSRGASGLQMLSVFTTQGGLLALVALVAGPCLAIQLALALVRWFIPASVLADAGVSPDYLATLVTPQAALLPALAGVLLGVAAVAAAALQWARLGVLAFRREQGRPSRQPFWRRYYLDVALAVLCFAGYLELGQFGSANTRLQLGGGPSPLLLIAPALLLVTGALLVLRLIPIGAALGARTAARGRGLTTMLAFAQVERSPNRYSRMTLLLVLAVGLGLFALTFDASLAQNAHDRAAYDTGADERLLMRDPISGGQDRQLLAQFQALPGVRAVSRVYRSRANTSSDAGHLSADTLGIDPTSFGQVAQDTSWRSDYAAMSLSTLLSDLNANVRGVGAGSANAPIYALVSQHFADQLALRVGDRFSLQLYETIFSSTSFVVGRIVQEFPTLYPTHSEGGFIVVNLADYFNAVQPSLANGATPAGPNEFWLKTSADPAQRSALLQALHKSDLNVDTVLDLRQAEIATESNPIGTGIRGLLVVGAITAALLAVLGSMIQALLATRQRATQFAILRTLGTARRQLAGLLLSEQVVVYLFGLVGGSLLGLLLTTATLPYLQFSDTLVDPSRIGVPPYVLVLNPTGMLSFYTALLGAFALALLIAARYAATIGLGQALRLGED